MGNTRAFVIALVVGLVTTLVVTQYQKHPQHNLWAHLQRGMLQASSTTATEPFVQERSSEINSGGNDDTTVGKGEQVETQVETETELSERATPRATGTSSKSHQQAQAPPPTSDSSNKDIPQATERIVTVWRNGGNNTQFYIPVKLALKPTHSLAGAIKAATGALVTSQVQFRGREEQKQRDFRELERGFNLFTATGTILRTLDGVKDGDTLYLVPRGHWFMWPGVRVGHKTRISVTKHLGSAGHKASTKQVDIETVSMRPRAFVVPDFLEPGEADTIIELAKPNLEGSGLYGTQKHAATRNSDQAWLYDEEHPVVKRITTRIGDLVRIPQIATEPSMGDHLQVVHYDPMEHYRYHHDYFEKEQFGDKRPDIKVGRNRFITVIFYLSDVEEGGDTAFPLADERYKGWDMDYYADCHGALKVKPRKNSAMFFYNLLADGQQEGEGDFRSLHAGCDVKKGQKWMSNKWIYNKPWNGPNVDAWIQKEGIDTDAVAE
eukprot:TRINITY_DN10288_c0_g1_i1.p1 TRINITY_DN10288_c0_g1~~TRINITY_DN10288_c0_g1_i1.p1  ORF type:complete len:493 (-),score=71.76 TRINITY_DN10288_c0_g1_i1:46-1524(-)